MDVTFTCDVGRLLAHVADYDLTLDLGPVRNWCGPTLTATPEGTSIMYATDDTTTVDPTPRPAYRIKTLRRMSAEDQLDAALMNLQRTGRARWGRRADRAARMVVAR